MLAQHFLLKDVLTCLFRLQDFSKTHTYEFKVNLGIVWTGFSTPGSTGHLQTVQAR